MAIVEFAKTLRNANRFQLEASASLPGNTVTGQTPEHGSIQVEDDRPRTKEFSAGVSRARVGYYKIWRQKRWIFISHFWKSDTGTESDTELGQQWVLAVDKKQEPVWFAERGRRHLGTLNLGFFSIEIGRDFYPETWGQSHGKEHKGAYAVVICIGNEKP